MLNLFKRPNLDAGIEEFQKTQGAILLDVRSHNEYQEGHIPNSVNISVQDISKAPTVIPDKQTPIFVYCLSGARSKSAVNALMRMGYEHAKSIGGINTYAGPIVKGK